MNRGGHRGEDPGDCTGDRKRRKSERHTLAAHGLLRESSRSNDREGCHKERNPRQDIRRVDELAPQEEGCGNEGRHHGQGCGNPVGAFTDIALGLESEELSAVSEADQQDRKASKNREGSQEGEETTGELVGRGRQRIGNGIRGDDLAGLDVHDLDLHALNEVREDDTQEDRDEPSGESMEHIPAGAPSDGRNL